jgi:hypothetical protein
MECLFASADDPATLSEIADKHTAAESCCEAVFPSRMVVLLIKAATGSA